jgi:hypothetical protein
VPIGISKGRRADEAGNERGGRGKEGGGLYTEVSAVSDASTEIGPRSRLLYRLLNNCTNPKRLSLAMNADLPNS